MSNQSEDTILDNITGLGWGISLVLAGLIFTIGNIGLGAMMGLPMILAGIAIPVLLTREAMAESLRQESRRRPEHGSSTTYTIDSKQVRRRR